MLQKKMGWYAAQIAVAFTLSIPASSQPAAPTLGAAGVQDESQPKRSRTTSKGDDNKEGSERIFGIFPAFNVSNELSPEPLTKKQKFKLFARGTYDPVTLIAPLLKVPILQATEEGSAFGTGAEGFAKRYGVLLADGTSSRFFRQYFFPAVLSEDPRYFRKAKGSVGSRIGYGVSRLFVTRTDSGHHRFNWSRLLGSAASAGLSNAYYPESQRGARATLFSFTISYFSETSANILKEFAPDIVRKLTRKKKGKAPPLEPLNLGSPVPSP